MAKNKNQQAQTSAQKNNQTVNQNNQNKKKQNNQPAQSKTLISAKPVNDVVTLMDFYRKVGYDFVDIEFSDESTGTFVLNNITTLAIKSTLTASENERDKFNFVPDSWYTPKQPVHICLSYNAFVERAKDISGASFAANIHHVVNTANDYLVKEYEDRYGKCSSKPEMRKFTLTEALDFLQERTINNGEWEKEPIFIRHEATKIVYQNESYCVFQDLNIIEDDWQVYKEYCGKEYGRYYTLEQNIQKQALIGGFDLGIRTDQIISLVPRKDRMKITDKEILDWISFRKK